MAFIFLIVFFIICVAGGYYLFTGLFDLFFGRNYGKDYYKEDKKPFFNIDRSVHYHTHNHEYGEKKVTYIDKNITVIDEETHENVLKNKKRDN
ncbi:hypothetical protein K5I29_04280 [Flavobacterium agricola]|uniref:Uncharacterized protein n=1 Tax=Flavobacterium agricola TaxID=2870839 RepID=A0ABY6M340_9FLAO|nr:hypothetical protein [Flavobacterium agricola]UYW02124.1 hypothetical protein K5I29_04280 [Flavobacterium agricola]